MATDDQDYRVGVGRITYDPSFGQRKPGDISMADMPGFSEWQKRVMAENDVTRLKRILRALVTLPAVQQALNPSGEPHVGACECPYCMALLVTKHP
jgi:hypothetical protein